MPIDDRRAIALSVHALNHHYGAKHALKDLSFQVDEGRFCVLLGLNGAGKTTLFSLLTRLYNHRSGQIHICGFDANGRPSEVLRRLGVVFQSRTLDLDLSVRQNLLYHASLQGIGRSEARARIVELLTAVDLAGRESDKVRSLSGGQMRRVEIARALMHRPKLLLLDEATVGLDVQSRASILKIIRGLVEEDGLSVLWATHLIDEVDRSDALLVLHQGALLAEGLVSDILAQTDTDSVEAAFNGLISRGDFKEVERRAHEHRSI